MSAPGLVVGIDLSLTATGVAAFGTARTPFARTVKTTPDDNTVPGFMKRCRRIASEIAEGFKYTPDLVVIEGLSYASKSSSIDKIHASWWVVQDELDREWGWPPGYKITPSQRAKYATGKGNASKDAVLIETVKRYPDLNIRNNNEADAVILAAMGMRALGYPVERSLPQANLDSVRDFIALLGGET